MNCPENAIYIIIGEMNAVLTAMKRSIRWSSHIQEDEEDSLLKSFINLKDSLINTVNICDLDPINYLSPFLDVIRSENTTGVVTCHGLSAVYKFLSYGLIDAKCSSAAVAAENIADAVTHARFMGTDASCDEVVLMKIIQVLRLLLLSPLGTLLTNESVCEIIQSFFRICFEVRFSEILRRNGESALMDAVQLLFSCLPQFTEDLRFSSAKRLKIRSGNISSGYFKKKKKKEHQEDSSNIKTDEAQIEVKKDCEECTDVKSLELTKTEEDGSVHENLSSNTLSLSKEGQKHSPANNRKYMFHPVRVEDENYFDSGYASSLTNGTSEEGSGVSLSEPIANYFIETQSVIQAQKIGVPFSPVTEVTSFKPDESEPCSLDLNFIRKDCDFDSAGGLLNSADTKKGDTSENLDASNENMNSACDVPEDESSLLISNDAEFVNPRGVRFTLHQTPKGCGPLIPYGLPCVRELFKLLISLINPQDRHNTELMILIGLNLVTVALESGADNLGNFSSLLALIKDEMCRNLFSLLSTDRLSIFSSCLRIFFLLFEALRTHLKFQLEMFLKKLMEIIVSESPKISYEEREIALDCITQLLRVPGLVTELYINYDCDLYCSNLFEDLIKLLSKNAFPLSGLYSVHLLSLDALIAVIDNIESNCEHRKHEEKEQERKSSNFPESQDELLVPKKSIIQQSASGYLLGQQLLSSKENEVQESDGIKDANKNQLNLKPNRMKVSINLPTQEELMAIKHKKKILASGTEQFNIQPSKGISFLQDHGLLSSPLEPQEVARFLRDNPKLDKKMIGEYISNRKNLKVLEAFVRSFTFENTRIDEALRLYFETFRLPGEAPLISLIMEHFAEHWHKSNKEPFANNDAAFTLAYAIIMLNVDQHNHNVKKQNIPMTFEDFKRNLKKVNGGEDFDEDMLEKIYTSIKCEEIVMPAEHTGLILENYKWKVLLRRGSSKEGKYIHTPNGTFDYELFSLIWGPSVAALSFIFDKSTDLNIVGKTVTGFGKCSMIAAHYGMCDVFDNLVISLCKFTTLVNPVENIQILPVSFGCNKKAQMATKALFFLAQRYGDMLREGWKNLLDCVMHLFKSRLLPKDMVEAEDFINPNKIISLIREEMSSMPRIEASLFRSFYSYITSDSPSQRLLTQEDELAKQNAIECVKECHCELLFTESKFLRIESLEELIKTLIFLCRCPEPSTSPCNSFDEDSTVFVVELLITIVLANRDRVLTIYPGIQDHLFHLVMNSAITEHVYLLERSVVGILRVAVRLVRKEEMIHQVLQSLQVLLYLKPPSLLLVSRQVSYALYELLKTNAANIHSEEDWSIIFILLERVGAGAKLCQKLCLNSDLPKRCLYVPESSGAQSDSELSVGRHTEESKILTERGYTSDSELYENQTGNHHSSLTPEKSLQPSESVNKDGEIENGPKHTFPPNQYNIILNQELTPHDSVAFLKSCESLAFLVRDAAHITAENFESCVHCIRTFVEASATAGCISEKKLVKMKYGKEKKWMRSNLKRKEEKLKRSRSQSSRIGEGYDADDEERHDDLTSAYQQVSMQLLDLMHTLHTRASSIFGHNEGLWTSCWCPLLQGIARLCCDTRRSIRTSALTLLPRALLVHDLQMLSPLEWEACFNKVLFPLLAKLLENISPDDPIGMEETRMRGATLLCKVFLQHLTPLLTLPTFMALWLTILDFLDKYMHADGSGLLSEAIPESLKNMLLVMDTAGVFKKPEEFPTDEDQMWHITWDRINAFLPELQNELFKPSHPPPIPINASTENSVEVTITISSENDACLSTATNATTEDRSATYQDNRPVSPPPLVISMPQEDAFQTTSVSVILHPPTTSLIYTTKPTPTVSSSPHLLVTSENGPTPVTVPLLLDPAVMSDASVPIFNSQGTSCSSSSL